MFLAATATCLVASGCGSARTGHSATADFMDKPDTPPGQVPGFDTGPHMMAAVTSPAPSPGSAPHIEHGALTCDPTSTNVSGFYVQWNNSRPITKIGATFRYRPESQHMQAGSGICLALLEGPLHGHPNLVGAIPNINVHFGISSDLWHFDTIIGEVEDLGNGHFIPPLDRTKGTVYTTQAEFVAADTVKLTLPTGSTHTVKNANIARHHGRWAFVEERYAAGDLDSPVDILRVWYSDQAL